MTPQSALTYKDSLLPTTAVFSSPLASNVKRTRCYSPENTYIWELLSYIYKLQCYSPENTYIWELLSYISSFYFEDLQSWTLTEINYLSIDNGCTLLEPYFLFSTNIQILIQRLIFAYRQHTYTNKLRCN